MTEFVDKEIVKEAIEMIANACLANPRITRGEIQTFFKGIPTADVRPVKRGKWIKDGLDWMKCSACGAVWWKPMFINDKWLYCPNCGADMRGGDDE